MVHLSSRFRAPIGYIPPSFAGHDFNACLVCRCLVAATLVGTSQYDL